MLGFMRGRLGECLSASLVLLISLPLVLSGKKKESGRADLSRTLFPSLGMLQQEELLITTLKPRHLNAKG